MCDINLSNTNYKKYIGYETRYRKVIDARGTMYMCVAILILKTTINSVMLHLKVNYEWCSLSTA